MARTPIISVADQNRAPPEIMFPFHRLEKAAKAAQSLEQAVGAEKSALVSRSKYYGKLGVAALPPIPTVATFCAARRQGWITWMIGYVTKTYPKATPRDDVIQSMGTFVDRAIEHQYPLQDESVRKALCEFALALRTNDFAGEDTTGTQIGNHTGGGLGGLGFKDD